MAVTVVYASPGSQQATAAEAFPGCSFEWSGPDGSVWDLGSGREGATLMSGVVGLLPAEAARYSSRTPAVAGSRHRGHNVGDGSMFWPLRLKSTLGSMAWINLYAAFWTTMRRDAPGQLTVRTPDGLARTRMHRFLNADDAGYGTDPSRVGRHVYGLRMIADDPFWSGPPVLSPLWQVTSGTPFIKTAAQGGSPAFRLTRSQVASSARWRNPGSEPGWPTWVVRGETTAPTTIAINGQTIGVPALAAGQSVTVVTSPLRQAAIREDGTIITGSMTAHGFASMPAREVVDVDISLTGPGSVQGSLIPRYEHPFGA